MGDEKKGYTPAPEVPEESKERFDAVMQAITGEMTVTEAAKKLGVSRVYFQTLMHQVLGAMIGAATKKRAGRKPRPEREAALQAKVRRLEAENTRLSAKTAVLENLLAGASELIRGSMRSKGRQATPGTEAKGEGSEEPGGRASWLLEAARELEGVLGSPRRAAVALRTGASTIRRFAARASRGETLVRQRGPGPTSPPDAQSKARVAALVYASAGLIGAGSLAAAVPSVSRRSAAAIKADAVSAIERARKAASNRVIVTAPGIVRGFDSMHVATDEGRRHLLVAGDGSVPFRTSAVLVPRYDGNAVADALERDFTKNGAPLVLRLDRWRAHLTTAAQDVLRHFGVLALHGPPHLARFYGQLERQNREHRAYLSRLTDRSVAAIAAAIPRMLNVLSGLWKRASLGWKTAREVWMARPIVSVDRDELREEVRSRSARIARDLALAGRPTYQADRFAIETALTRRGFLRRANGGHR